MKPVAEHCLRNQAPIAEALHPYLEAGGRWLELGSGTGQHGVFIAGREPQVQWQLSDVAEAHAGLLAWQSDAGLPNLPPPWVLDVTRDEPPPRDFDGVFTANTLHFVGGPVVDSLLCCAAGALVESGWFAAYGPFNREGQYTSAGNAALDGWLRGRDPDSGLRDEAEVIGWAADHHLAFVTAQDMPANNRLLIFTKKG
ncbi:DUF938 domain-containing protein [Marinobacter halodurans]|uniref:DUF938 domain-containing protein n=1 Tax=Marinobacter halodurans TaxID=2528979 RepID=A0ABY1ZRI0_9GAMM|nr:DUF938 domain-containing protein [Marinobacter halodurans]TBW58788.1 DUF938 domain-containing protein [Marinobacter halodurans]